MIRVLWFSPLPPARTDIANYTSRLQPFLKDLVDLQLVHPDGANVEAAYGSVAAESLSHRELNSTDVCVYHLGNNAQHHASIFVCAQRHPGVVVLHDRAINEFLLGMYSCEEQQGGEPAAHRYRTAMGRWYGREGLRTASAVLLGKESARTFAAAYPLYEAALHGALGVICHNPAVCHEIRNRFPKLPILGLPLPYPHPPTGLKTTRKANQSIVQLAMFGFMGKNRRLMEFLRIWAESPYRTRFNLDLVGELDEKSEVFALLQQTGLDEQVHFHGFLPDDALDEVIAAAEMVLNLRNPTMGEASGSQLRIWANQTASTVSDCGWYALLPNDCVYKIGLESEADDIARLLERLANGEIDLSDIAAKGRAQLVAHDPARYAADLVSWLEGCSTPMATEWAEMKLMEAVARSYAESLPPGLKPSIPGALLRRDLDRATNLN